MTPTPPSPGQDPLPPESMLLRQGEVSRLVEEVLAQRRSGRHITDAEVIADHPGLMPQLEEQLLAAGRIEQAQRAAERAGRLDEPIDALEMDDLNAPLLPLSRDTAPGMEECQVSIQGYQIIGEISRGGQATVYKAHQEATGRIVAVKVLSGGQNATSAGRVRFEREVKHLASLSHANIVDIVDRGRAIGGAFYLAMEFVDGPALDEYFRQRQPLSIPDVLRVFKKIAAALVVAHAQGIVHRDLKPANVRIDPHGEPRLLDFGLARLISDDDAPLSAMPTITLPHQIVGSIPWASPEQVQGKPIDHRSDIYSFGFMLYFIVKGAYPFPAASLMQALQSMANAPQEPLRSGNTALDAVVERCMERKPAHRYQSADELLHALEAVPDRQRRAWLPAARRWALRAGIAVILTAAASAIVGYAFRNPPPSVRTKFSDLATTVVNDDGMEFRLIRRGFFLMGSPPDEAGRHAGERQHPVELTEDFYIGRTEVTEKQYRSVMGAAPAATQDGAADRAMVNVTWQDAMEFCRKLSIRDRRTYRLPTEAEWEYACRAGSTGPFCDPRPEDVGWFGLAESAEAPRVATKRPNAWGIYDMHGGVREWCLTGYLSYAGEPVRDPRTPVMQQIAVRGGAYTSAQQDCRAAARAKQLPGDRDAYLGFRVVLEVQ